MKIHFRKLYDLIECSYKKKMRVSALKKTTCKQISTHPNRTLARCVIMLLILIPPSQHSQWPCKQHKSDGGDHLIKPTTPRKDWGTFKCAMCLSSNKLIPSSKEQSPWP